MIAAPDPPSALLIARRSLDEFDDVEVLEDWISTDRGWTLKLRLCLAGVGGSLVPPVTDWYVITPASYPRGVLSLFPAKDGGLSSVFYHQIRQRDSLDVPWQNRKICVATSSENNALRTDDEEPRNADVRLAWQVRRAIDWLKAADTGTLVSSGDPWELPWFPNDPDARIGVAFREDADTYALWRGTTGTHGTVGLVRLPGSRPEWVAQSFRSPDGRTLVAPDWGRRIATAAARDDGVWFRLAAVPVFDPYQAPATWGELRTLARQQGVDLDSILRPLLSLSRKNSTGVALMGFPVPSRFGGPPSQMYWEPIRLPPLTPERSGKHPPIPGFRPGEPGAWRADRTGAFAETRDVDWGAGENWHPDQLAARGRLRQELVASRVALLGAGALGGCIAELLVRAGVTDVALIDREALVAGNLVRHTLTLDQLGDPKATAVAARLNAASPNANVTAYPATFPDLDAKLRAALDAADLVIDATASSDVTLALGDYAWPTPRRFLLASILYEANRLLWFAAEGASFPVADFEAAVEPWLKVEREAGREFPWEGVGCYHPVFPARADHIWLLAAATVSSLEDCARPAPFELRVFERHPDGTLERIIRP